MIELLDAVLPYISGLYTLPWIIVGFVATLVLASIFSRPTVDLKMKNIALILLYFFVPPLVFRIFLDTPLGAQEGIFILIVAAIICFMYLLAYLYGSSIVKRKKWEGKKRTLFLKTIITNQGRSSAFVGGIMLAIPSWGVPAGIFMALVGIALFAVVPFVLYKMNNREKDAGENPMELPWFLRFYPWYFIIFPIAGFLMQRTTGLTTGDMGSLGTIIRFYTALTIPAALYYVGSGIHPSDMKISELKKLLRIEHEEGVDHWSWVRHIFMLTTFVTPIIITLIFIVIMNIRAIGFPPQWFAVIVINATLPITSTNMFLVPYGIDKRSTAHSITWSTLVCVPLVIIMISIFSIYFS